MKEFDLHSQVFQSNGNPSSEDQQPEEGVHFERIEDVKRENIRVAIADPQTFFKQKASKKRKCDAQQQ